MPYLRLDVEGEETQAQAYAIPIGYWFQLYPQMPPLPPPNALWRWFVRGGLWRTAKVWLQLVVAPERPPHMVQICNGGTL